MRKDDRKAVSVRCSWPGEVVIEIEFMNGEGSKGKLQSLASIAQTVVIILAICDGEFGSVFGLEGRLVFNHENVGSGSENGARGEVEVDAFGEAHVG